jgi:hypothetical protein
MSNVTPASRESSTSNSFELLKRPIRPDLQERIVNIDKTQTEIKGARNRENPLVSLPEHSLKMQRDVSFYQQYLLAIHFNENGININIKENDKYINYSTSGKNKFYKSKDPRIQQLDKLISSIIRIVRNNEKDVYQLSFQDHSKYGKIIPKLEKLALQLAKKEISIGLKYFSTYFNNPNKFKIIASDEKHLELQYSAKCGLKKECYTDWETFVVQNTEMKELKKLWGTIRNAIKKSETGYNRKFTTGDKLDEIETALIRIELNRNKNELSKSPTPNE